jgi:hypothetical protein
MIRFKYRIPHALEQLVQTTIIDYHDEYFYGLMEEGVVHQLQHYQLFLVCQTQNLGSITVYKNPLVVVAKNESDALRVFYEDTKIGDASVHSILETHCDKIKVEPII